MVLDRVLAILRTRSEVAAVAALLLVIPFLRRDIELGVLLLGVVAGSGLVLYALGLVLIYRASRILNFAQVAIGTAAGTLMVVWVRAGPFYQVVHKVCEPCFEEIDVGGAVTVLRVPMMLQYVNYGVAVVLAISFALLLSVACAFVVARFAEAPRLVVTISTVLLAATLAGISHKIVEWLARKPVFVLPFIYPREAMTDTELADQLRLNLGAVPPPVSLTVRVGPIPFNLVQMLTVLAAAVTLALLAWFFRRSDMGTAVRAVAENSSRASTLGVSVDAVGRRVWLISGGLSGVAGVLVAMSAGLVAPAADQLANQATPVDFGLSLLVRILAVAVLARLVSLPMVGVGALALGLFEQAIRWSYGSSVVVDVCLFVIVVAVLLLQHERLSRGETEQAAAWRADREVRPIPQELRSLPVVRSYVRSGSIVGALLVLGLPWVLSAGQAVLASSTIILAIVGLSLLVLTGWTGQISLGQFAISAIAAYAVAVLQPPMLLILPLAALVGAVAAVLVGLPVLRLGGLSLAIVTLAFGLATSALLLDAGQLGKHLPPGLARPALLGMSLEDERAFYYLVVSVFAVLLGGVRAMRRSRTGRTMIASRDNAQQAETFGINLLRARLTAFAVSGALAGVAGALYAYAQHGVRVTGFSPERSVELFLAAVIGGFGTPAGPVLGVIALGLLGFVRGDPSLVLGAGGLVLVLFSGGGMSQLVVKVRDNMLRRVAARQGIVVPSLVGDGADGAGRKTAKLSPKPRASGGHDLVAGRYKVNDQWALGDDVARRPEGVPGG